MLCYNYKIVSHEMSLHEWISLRYFGSTFLLFVIYFFIYAPPKSNRSFQIARNNGGFQTVRNNEVSKNCRKVNIFQGFVKTVGNPLATLNLPGEKQIATNVLNGG